MSKMQNKALVYFTTEEKKMCSPVYLYFFESWKGLADFTLNILVNHIEINMGRFQVSQKYYTIFTQLKYLPSKVCIACYFIFCIT